MDSPHLSADRMEAYRARRLDPDGVLALHDHLAACPICRERLAQSYPTEALAAPGEEHEVSEQDLVDYAQRGVERARVERHLAGCGECREALQALREEQQDRRGKPAARLWLPLAAALAAILVPAALWRASRSVEPPVLAAVQDGGGQLALRQDGVLRGAPGLPAADRELMAAALRSGTLPVRQTQLQAEPASALRSNGVADAAFAVVGPVGRRVLSPTPRFVWTPAAGATAYEVTIVSEDLQEVARSGMTTKLEWTPAEPLPNGRPLQWQVSARTAGGVVVAPAPPAPIARFEVVPTSEAARIDEAVRRAPPQHLLLAVLYASAGLREEAAAELDRLERLNPGSALLKSLRESLH